MSNDNNNNLTVSETILAQLGGWRFISMTGASSLVGDPGMLQFSLPKNERKINKVRIELTPADTYTVKFYSIRQRGLSVNVIAEREGVYAENLREVFERETGLYTSL